MNDMQDVIAHYYFRPDNRTTPQEAAQAIAEEQSTGTWTTLTTQLDYVRRLDGVVESVEESGRGYLTAIRFPAELFEQGNVPQYLSVVAGNVFGLGRLEAVRLVDVEFPESLVRFNGPNFGIEGVRKLLGTHDRPHVGTIIKPKLGLNPADTADLAYEAASGGVDFIKDDETLTNHAFCPMVDRVEAVMARLDEAKDETGRLVLYAVNVSDRADRIVERAEEALERGANTLMVDVITCGYSALEALAEEPGIHVPIHVHRTMHAAMTRNPEHGIAMRPIARLVRMMGGDQLHTGTVSGKMGGNAEEVILDNHALTDPWYGFRPVFPVASGGLHPGKVHAELETLGTEIVLQAGGGIHGHPDGTAAGARAMRQAVDAFLEGVSATEYAKTHVELARALNLWGSS